MRDVRDVVVDELDLLLDRVVAVREDKIHSLSDSVINFGIGTAIGIVTTTICAVKNLYSCTFIKSYATPSRQTSSALESIFY